jgi:hypothetical protein
MDAVPTVDGLPCPPPVTLSWILTLLKRGTRESKNDEPLWLINFGARIEGGMVLRSASGRWSSNHDLAWDVVAHGPRGMRVVAVEAEPRNCKAIHVVVKHERAAGRPFAGQSIAVECAFVRGVSVAAMLSAHGVPRNGIDRPAQN